jgi:hypothetical protein
VTVKVTYQFAAVGYRWSETHYLPGFNFTPGALGPQQAAAAPAIALGSLRSALLGYGAALFNIRLSAVPANRIVADIPLPGGATGKWQSFENSSQNDDWTDFPDTAVMMQFMSAAGQKRMWLAGIPDFVCQDSAAGQPFSYNGGGNPQWQTMMNAWIAGITNNGWGYRSLKTSVPVPVIGLVQGIGSPALAGLTTAAPIGAAVGSEVLVRGFRRSNTRLPSLSGTYQVASVVNTGAPSTAVTYYLADTGDVSLSNFPVIGTIAIPLATYPTYVSATPARIGRRKRGDPSDRVRGRSSVR